MLSVEEVTLLLRAASAPKYKAAFATAGACPRAGQRPDPWGAGLRVSEVVALKVGDIDSERMLLRVERDFGAWLGLVPRQYSTGGRSIFGHISKRGSRYLRMLLVQAARVLLMRPHTWSRFSFGA